MKNIILFDDDHWKALLPLSYTRPICELRVGILTLSEKWALRLNGTVSYITQEYLAPKYPIDISQDNFVINGRILPNDKLVRIIDKLELNQALLNGEDLIAARLDNLQFDLLIQGKEMKEMQGIDLSEHTDLFTCLARPYDIFKLNGQEIQSDFDILTRGRNSKKLSDTNRILGKHPIFLEAGAKVECSILNASDGPIYIGKNAEIMEGSIVRGPFAMCENAVLKMGAKIYGPTTLGPYSKVGGEVNNVVFHGYSNKGHDGFLGNAAIGEWCNIGADSNNSNLKNNYAEVKLWDYTTERFSRTGLQFCGLIMGDHSKCGINTMFNTGTVVGVSANIFGSGFPRNFIPSFSWGGNGGFSTFQMGKVTEVAERMMERRGLSLSEEDRNILSHIMAETAKYRSWEKA